MAKLIPPHVLAALPPANAATITGKSFFPHLISNPFMHGLRIAFTFSAIIYLLAAVASWMRGKTAPPAGEPSPEIVVDRDQAIEETVSAP
jgi:hypothetical protein